MNPFLQEVVVSAVKNQRWYQRNANTIVAGLVALASILSFVATLELNLPAVVAAAIPATVTLIGALVTKLTRNGVQMSTLAKLEAVAPRELPVYDGPTSTPAYVGKHRLEG